MENMKVKPKLLILGAGGLGRMTLDIATDKFDCYFVDDAYSVGDCVCNTIIVGTMCDLPKIKDDYDFFVVAIGNNSKRQEIMDYCFSLGLKGISIISDHSYISKWSKMGVCSIVMPFASIQNGADIGSGLVLCSHSEIHHDANVGNCCVIYPNSTIRTYAKLGDRVKCGSNVSVGNGVLIENDSVLENGTSY